MSKTAAEIRREFVEFFCRKHGHTHVPGAPVIPYDDPTLLFTNAGMNQFKPLFLGTADRGSEFGRLKRAANSQPCIRAGGKHNDLDDVGHDTYHHTFFEMLGNWSFGDYFKKEAIEWAWELITKVWGIDASRIHATYFGGDPAEGLEPDLEARDLWCGVPGMSPERVHPGNKKDNFWEMGDTGPCGPCSEMHIDLTPDKSGGPLVNAGDERVIEFWNLVFIQFNRGPDDKLSPLPAKHVDTGMGFERITRIVQGKRSNYDIDVFTPIFAAIQRVSGAAAYGGRMEVGEQGNKETKEQGAGHADLMRDVAYRVIADHIRTLTFAISDGCPPDKDGRGFVLRRILRRAVRYGWQYLGLKKPFLCELVPTVVEVMGDSFPRLRGPNAPRGTSSNLPTLENPAPPSMSPERVAEIIRDEEQAFARTLDRGIALFEDAAQRAKEHHGEIAGADAFKLHDTFGFPIDLTEIMAQERGLRVDIGEYERLMEEAREKARQTGRSTADWVSGLPASFVASLARTDDAAKFTSHAIEAEVVSMFCIEDDGRVSFPPRDGALFDGQRGVLILDRTAFYAEQGGQCGDIGVILTDAEESESQEVFWVDDTIRLGDAVAHVGRVLRGGFGWNEPVFIRVDARRIRIERNHTATHILNLALRNTLGNHIDQKGSLVDPEKTRFDFSHPKPISPDEITKIESMVTQQIKDDLVVDTNENVPVDQAAARKINTLRAVFGEKYPDKVRVVAIGAKVADLLNNPTNPEWMNYSVEFCGGTHVKRTSEIGQFAIVAEEAVAKGIRRVVGLTGEKAREAIENGKRMIAELERARKLAASSGGAAAGASGGNAGGESLSASVAALQKAIVELPMRVVDRQTIRDGLAELQELAKKQQKQAAAASADSLKDQIPTLIASATRKGDTTIIVAELPDSPIDALKTACDTLKQKCGSTAILLGTREAGGTPTPPGKATLLAAVTDDLIKKGIKAGDWIKAVAPIVEGGGGGPPTMAQAGGKNPAKLGEALEAGKTWMLGKL